VWASASWKSRKKPAGPSPTGVAQNPEEVLAQRMDEVLEVGDRPAALAAFAAGVWMRGETGPRLRSR